MTLVMRCTITRYRILVDGIFVCWIDVPHAPDKTTADKARRLYRELAPSVALNRIVAA